MLELFLEHFYFMLIVSSGHQNHMVLYLHTQLAKCSPSFLGFC